MRPKHSEPLWRVLALVAVLLVGGLLIVACGDDDEGGGAEVFRFADDDLCEWISEDEVTEFVREAYALSGIDWEGDVAAAEPSGSAWDLPGGDYCTWIPTGGGHVIARGLTPSQFSPPNDYSEADYDAVTHGSVSGHPDFPDGIIAAGAAFGRYGFWLEDSDEVLGLEVLLDESDSGDWSQQEKMLFHIANSFLAEMGWAP